VAAYVTKTFTGSSAQRTCVYYFLFKIFRITDTIYEIFLEIMGSNSHYLSVKKYYEALDISEIERLAVNSSSGWKTGPTKKRYYCQ
jgi:hypothetical protein